MSADHRAEEVVVPSVFIGQDDAIMIIENYLYNRGYVFVGKGTCTKALVRGILIALYNIFLYTTSENMYMCVYVCVSGRERESMCEGLREVGIEGGRRVRVIK